MNHSEFKEILSLGLENELTTEERSAYNAHLATCNECKAEADSVAKLHNLLVRSTPVVVDDALLSEARRDLRAALRNEKNRSSIGEILLNSIGFLLTPKFGLALGAVAMLAIGTFAGAWFAGRHATAQLAQGGETTASVSNQGWQNVGTVPENSNSGTEHTSIRNASTGGAATGAENVVLHQDDAKITNVKILENDPGSGKVEFTFEAVTPMHIKGSVNDPRVQKVLANALLNAENPGVRLRSVTAIASHAESNDLPADKDIKKALLKALQSDDNPAVRKEALRALVKFRIDDDIKKGFLSALAKDNNAGIRIAIINSLDSMKTSGATLGNDVLEVLKQRMQSDDNNYVRIRAKAAMQTVRD